MKTMPQMIEAVQVLETVKTDDEAAELATALMSLEGFLGGRVYERKGLVFDGKAKCLVMGSFGWNVQMFFARGTITGRDVLVPRGLAVACGIC